MLRGFASVAFGDPKISINYKWSGALPIGFVVATLIPNNSLPKTVQPEVTAPGGAPGGGADGGAGGGSSASSGTRSASGLGGKY